MKAIGHLRFRVLLTPVLLAMTLVFSSCVQVDFDSEFQRSGIAVHTLSVILPKDAYEAAEVAGETARFDEISSNAASAGLNASTIFAPETVTLQVSVERPDGEDAGAALNSLLNATGINQSPGISAPFSGFFRQEGAAVGGNLFVLDMNIDGELLYEYVASTDAASGESLSRIEENVSIAYQVSVPGDLRDSTGAEIAPGVIRWEISPGEMISTQTETSAGDTSRTALFILAGFASVVGVIFLAGLIGWILVRRPRLATSIGSAASHFPRRTTITREGVWVSDRVRQLVERIWHRGAPHHDLPVRHDLLDANVEESNDGPDTEGNRSPAGIHGGGTCPEA